MRSYTDHEITDLLSGKEILVASYEAGGAEILSSLLRRFKGKEKITYILNGPAKEIFRARIPNIVDNEFSSELFNNKDLVLTGTSLVPEWERQAIQLARESGVRTISIVDHWVNYRQRFLPAKAKDTDLANYLPDEIWVADTYAYALAQKEQFPKESLRLITNYYLEDLKQKMAGKTIDGSRTLLYVCEPVFDDLQLLYGNGNIWGYNEYDLVGDLFHHLEEIEGDFDKLVLRLHPNEDPNKYNDVKNKYKGRLPVEISHYRQKRIEDECAQAGIIVGVESMALVIGLLLKKPTFSCLPKTAKKKCALPHREIAHICSISELNNNPVMIEWRSV